MSSISQSIIFFLLMQTQMTISVIYNDNFGVGSFKDTVNVF